MGLDMYLNAKRYLSDYNEADLAKKREMMNLFPELAVYLTQENGHPIKEITASVGYWRKANAIHGWFVQEVQEGEDDCNEYYVSREKLEELKNLCEQVLANRSLAAKLLPSTSGFFFGGTEYDDSYFSDLELTVEIVNDTLLLSDKDWNFYYQSSW
jgi:hypothetical protein